MNYRLAYAIGFHPWEDGHGPAIRISHECTEQKRECGGCGEWHPQVECDESSHRQERQPRDGYGRRSAECQAGGAAGNPGERQYKAHAARVILAPQPGEHRERDRRDQMEGQIAAAIALPSSTVVAVPPISRVRGAFGSVSTLSMARTTAAPASACPR
jgi:hypothetical protein